MANGYIDKWKQDQLYVQIGKDGVVSHRRVVTQKQFEDAMERAQRMSIVVKNMLNDESIETITYKLVIEAFRALFMTFESDV